MSTKSQAQLLNQLDNPKGYIVYMLNDDYTSWDFCLRIIIEVFHKTLEEADEITNEIHTKGRGFCGVYAHEIAETKAHLVRLKAREEGFPMKCTLEEQ